MSSETWISNDAVSPGHDRAGSDGVPPTRSSAGPDGVSPKRDSAKADELRPWQLFTLAGLIGATIVVFLSRGESPAGIILLSCSIFAAAYVGLAALRTFMPLAGAQEPEPEVVGGRTRAALEREKALVLRSIKELEFDRGMGKVSDKDFAEMSARLRARAARLMRELDAGSLYRDQIEREVERRVGSKPAHTVERPEPVEARSGPAVCASCDIQNDPDAKFCKNCGARLEAA